MRFKGDLVFSIGYSLGSHKSMLDDLNVFLLTLGITKQ